MQWKRVLGAGTASAVLAVAPVLAAGPAHAAAGDAKVTVVHGIPDTPVDVYVNGAKTLSDFQFKTVTDPLSLPGGSYQLEVRKAGDPDSAAPILQTTADVPAGANVTVVAALTAGGEPKLVPFVNSTAAVGSGKGTIVVRHTAAAPAVDVYAGDAKVITGLTNPNEKSLTVPAGTISAKVTVSGQTDAVIGPVDVPVMAGMATIVYAVGSASGGNLTAVTQQVALGGSPGGAQAGSGGAAGDDPAPVWPYALLGVAALGLAGYGGRSLRTARA